MTKANGEDSASLPHWRQAADEIFEAFMTCMHKNLQDEAERMEAHRYFLHAHVWLLSGENSVADEVDHKLFVSWKEK